MAARWTETPDLFVTSPYLRTQQTTAATIERFQNVPVEAWPIQEFTYSTAHPLEQTLSAKPMPTSRLRLCVALAADLLLCGRT